MSVSAWALPPPPPGLRSRLGQVYLELRGTWRALRRLGAEAFVGDVVVVTEDPKLGARLRTRMSPEGDQLTRVEAPTDADPLALQALTDRHLAALALRGVEARARLRLLLRLPLLLASLILGLVALANAAWYLLTDLHLLVAVVLRWLSGQPGFITPDVIRLLQDHAWLALSGFVFPALSAWLTARLNRWLVARLRTWLRDRIQRELGL